MQVPSVAVGAPQCADCWRPHCDSWVGDIPAWRRRKSSPFKAYSSFVSHCCKLPYCFSCWTGVVLDSGSCRVNIIIGKSKPHLC